MNTGVGGRFTFPRSASLKRRNWIRALFDRERGEASTVSGGCIRILFRLVEDESPVPGQRIFVGFSAGSRHRTAVRRNRIKRLLRESFRLNQHALVEHLPRTGFLTMMILYRHPNLKSFREIDADLRQTLKALAAELDKTPHYG